MNVLRSVAILGAGMAGATAARRLAEAGLTVQVFDKGRGIGGRMATRRTEAAQFDHGAQFMRAHGDAFAARLAHWKRLGIVEPWSGSGRHVGVPGMTAPVRALLADLPVACATTITRIRRHGRAWRVEDGAGAAHGPYDAVAVTFPAPQALDLIETSGFVLPGIARARYAPCWSLMLGLETAPPTPLIEPPEGPIGLIAHDSSKPGRPAGVRLTVHATPHWSRRHLEDPREAVISELIQATGAQLGVELSPSYAAVHRWRYAQVETALGVPSLYDHAVRLGAAGDWCIGARIEAAHDSGLHLAETILTDLDANA